MTKGYIVQANTELELQQSELLANTLAIRNKDTKISLVTSLDVENNNVFDKILNYNFGCTNPTRCNDWQMYWVSPYEHTILLDCKMLVLELHENMWEYLIDHYDVCFPSTVLDYRLNKIVDKRHEVYKEEYNFNKVYANMFYFNKSDASLRYFKFLDPLMQNWQETFNNMFLRKDVLTDFDVDLIHTVVANTIDIDVFPLHNDVFSYIDMHCMHKNNLLPECNKWTDIISTWATSQGRLKLQNYSITKSLYYYEDSFFNETLADIYRTYRNAIAKDLLD